MSKWSLPGRASWAVILSSFLRCRHWRQLRERTNTSQQNSGYTWIWTQISLFSKPGLLNRTGNCVYQEHLQAKEPKNQASESYSRTLQKVLSGHGAISCQEWGLETPLISPSLLMVYLGTEENQVVKMASQNVEFFRMQGRNSEALLLSVFPCGPLTSVYTELKTLQWPA